MITDEERRKVVRELRKRSHMVSVQSAQHQLHEILGVGGTEIFGMLADLIEPQTSEQTNPQESSLSTSLCGRDALLALADWMDRDVAETEKHFSNVISTRSVSDYACRIREACAEAGAEPPKPEDMTTCGAYDLLSDEDRETLRWVREQGGLGKLKADALCWNTAEHIAQDFMDWLARVCPVAGIGKCGYGEALDRLDEAIGKRLMPEGMEWPRYESGEPVKPGSWLQDNDGEAFEAVSFVFTCDWWGIHGYRPDRYGTIGAKYRRQLDGMAYGTHVKRPAIDALAGRVKSVPTGD